MVAIKGTLLNTLNTLSQGHALAAVHGGYKGNFY
jgi:hypothetical protein